LEDEFSAERGFIVAVIGELAAMRCSISKNMIKDTLNSRFKSDESVDGLARQLVGGAYDCTTT
jgi:hypothetical protein